MKFFIAFGYKEIITCILCIYYVIVFIVISYFYDLFFPCGKLLVMWKGAFYICGKMLVMLKLKFYKNNY